MSSDVLEVLVVAECSACVTVVAVVGCKLVECECYVLSGYSPRGTGQY